MKEIYNLIDQEHEDFKLLQYIFKFDRIRGGQRRSEGKLIICNTIRFPEVDYFTIDNTRDIEANMRKFNRESNFYEMEIVDYVDSEIEPGERNHPAFIWVDFKEKG